MNCEHCQGVVDVPCFYGGGVRCGCGKTIVRYPPAPPVDPLASLRDLARALRAERVSSYSANGLTLVMHESAWRNEVPDGDTPAEAKPEICKCGHALAAEHNEAGCFHGCALGVCEESLKEAAA